MLLEPGQSLLLLEGMLLDEALELLEATEDVADEADVSAGVGVAVMVTTETVEPLWERVSIPSALQIAEVNCLP